MAVNAGSAYLREIAEREGREPTEEEARTATNMVREKQGMEPMQWKETPDEFRAMVDDGPSAWGKTVIDSVHGDVPMQGGVKDPMIPLRADHSQRLNLLYGAERAQIDAIITGDSSDFEEKARKYSQGADTVLDERIEWLEDLYSAEFIDQGALEQVRDMDPMEAAQVVIRETERLNANKLKLRDLITINLLRQGEVGTPRSVVDQMEMSITTAQAEGLRRQHLNNQLKELNAYVDRIAAQQGEGWDTINVLEEIVQQDFIPFYGATTRVVGGLEFLPENLEISTWRKGLPGETRQAIREWFVNASQEERMQWVKDLEQTWSDIRKGPNSKFYTRYMVVENMMGLFTDALLYDDDPQDTADRILGNLDTALGALIGASLLIKRGVSIFDMFSANKANPARQLAAAAGARANEEKLDAAILALAKEKGATTGEAVVHNLPKPKPVADKGIPVELDTVKHTTTPNDLRRQRILSYTDDADATLLDGQAKAAATDSMLTKLQKLLEQRDSMHINHKMSVWRPLPNDVGIEVDVVLTPTVGDSWNDLGELLADMKDFDPYEQFTILKRNKDGVLEELDISFSEIVRFYSDGTIPKGFNDIMRTTDELEEVRRFFGSRKLDRISTQELRQAIDEEWVPVSSPAYKSIQDEIANRTLLGEGYPDPLLTVNGDELFVKMKQTHYWDANDIQNIDGFKDWDIFSDTGQRHLRGKLVAPSVKFDKLYDAVLRNYQMEEAALAEFSDMLAPFYKLNTKQRQNVAEIIEWVEEFAKDVHHETGIARAPSAHEIFAEFPHFDDKVFEGYAAMREAMDGLYDVFNRRMFREYTNNGYKTMRGLDDSLPTYHGRPMRLDGEGELRLKPGAYYDPVRREMVTLSADDLAALADEGGGALKLEFAIDTPSGGKTTRVLARKGEYEIGELSKKPLSYYEGYHFRFYEDPYYIIKRNYEAVVDGETLAPGKYLDEAVRTAGSSGEAFRFLRGAKQNAKGEFVTKSGEHFLIVPSRQINFTEGSLYQHQTIQKEGRMFWDERSMERLPDVTGNRAKIADPFRAMQKGLEIGVRQSTQESIFKAMKVGFENEFGDLPAMAANKASFQMDELRVVEKKLEEGLAESPPGTSGQAVRQRYKDAIEYIRYMRSQMGTSSAVLPKVRAWSLHIAQWLDDPDYGILRSKKLRKLNRWLQSTAMSMDPFARARKIAYGAFMVLRPIRQLALQAMQISMLVGLAPTYIGSGKIVLDSIALRRGLSRFRKAGFDDGWSDSQLAKVMGYSTKEYKRLVEEFQRSGLMGSVNTHAHNARARSLQSDLPSGGVVATNWYRTKKGMRSLYDTFAQGFELGEKANLTTTYMLALKRYARENKITDLTKMSRKQWDAVAKQADGLALSMTRPNKFGYQSGFTGTMFQFMSFQHRAFMTMLGFNRYLKPKDRWKIFAGAYMLWGTNIFGAENWTKEFLANKGLNFWGEQEVEPGIKIVDVLISGFVDAGMNRLLADIQGVEQDLDIGGTFAPGANIVDLYKRLYEAFTEAPMGLHLLGPISTPVNGFLDGLNFLSQEMHNEFKTPAENIVRTAKFMAEQTLPFANDITKTWVAAQTGMWEQKNGDKLGIQASTASIFARLALGVRTEEELSIYRARRLLVENEDAIDAIVQDFKPILKQAIKQWENGTRNRDWAYEQASVIIGLTEDMPEGIRREVYTRLMQEPDTDGKSVIDVLAEFRGKGSYNIRALQPHINNSSMSPADKKAMNEYIDFLAEGHKSASLANEELVRKEIEARRNQ